ncbi:DNA adenine methylase [Cyanobacterium sp. IPPAS B-1200]|uniref:DNA adenine methylase n=1 Tax=Cyanobacterium sp. IPPAS B-1200 TaxID=1562720 RepID=UPI0008526728|nr:DNA adenine methylase [Cyanobacterium sp. IPPAS B-1200]OEJ77475.1 modification methylase [Cyanobacterium sp. IPPAS B-1200]
MKLIKIKDNNKAKPFLKWAGGKTQLLETFRQYYPKSLLKGEQFNYIEPFIGGGAVFFDLVQNYNIRHSHLSDINPEIVIVYKTIQKSVESLIEQLTELSEEYKSLNVEQKKHFFYLKRDIYNLERIDFNYIDFSEAWIKRSALLIFLNKTCFNGLFRTNKKGGFNVPHGKYKNPNIVDKNNLLNVSNILQNTDIKIADYSQIIQHIKNNSFIYFDPPYRPLNQTSNFNSYSKMMFDDNEQKRLANFYKQLNNNYSVDLMLSNSDPKNENPNDNFFDELYQGFNIYRIPATRMINSKGNKRGIINELLITN